MGFFSVKFNTDDFDKGSQRLLKQIGNDADKAVSLVADEVLRLSQSEVPHDTGYLQSTGNAKRKGEAHYVVGYHTTYAARLHEHPEFNFQKGRKGKYLEDPIKKNLSKFQKILGKSLKASIN